MNLRMFWSFASLFFINFMMVSLPTGMTTPFLTSLGVSQATIGLLLSGAALLSIGLEILIGVLADRSRKIKPYLYTALVLVMGFVSLLYQQTQTGVAIIVAVIGSAAFIKLVNSLLDSYALESDPTIRINYGKVRLFGSIGFSFGLSVIATFIMRWGFFAIIPTTCILGSLLIVLLVPLRDVAPRATTLPAVSFQRLLNATYVQRLVILFFVFFVIGVEDMAISMKFLSIGADPIHIAWYYSAQAFFELPLFYFGPALIRRFKASRVLAVGILALILKMLYFATFNDVPTLLGGTLIQVLTFPLVMISAKTLLYDASPDDYKISGQMFGNAASLHLSGILAPMVVGALIGLTSPSWVLMGLGGLLLIPLVMNGLAKPA